MKAFHITVTIETGESWSYPAIAWHAVDVQTSALDRFGPCKTSVRPR
jgi:hypothetical protein